MVITVSAVTVATLSLLLPLCVCKRKTKLSGLTRGGVPVVPQRSIEEKKMQSMQIQGTQEMVTATKSTQKELEISAVCEKKLTNLKTAQFHDALTVDVTQCSKSELIKSQEVSSHDTLKYVKPRVRLYGRAREIAESEPIDRQCKEYRTLMFIDGNDELFTEKIYPREVRQQDLTQYKIEKYYITGYKMPEMLEEYTCRDDDF